jgi:endo-alpha-1,4-polygalactosaminidase (GH114 family)
MINKRQQFKNASNYVLYYGIGKENELKTYNIAIVEPQGQNENSIDMMNKEGTLVIAYVSVMEIYQSHSLFKLLKDEDFIKLNGLHVMNEEYGTYLLDLRSKRWKTLLIHHIGNLILNQNYDGIFLDTIGDVESPVLPEYLKEKLFISAEQLIKEIRNLFKEIIIIQNNGMNELINYTCELIDGLCWENPSFCDDSCLEWTQNTLNKLKIIHNTKGIKILMLYEKNQLNFANIKSIHFAEEVARINNFLMYITDKYA